MPKCPGPRFQLIAIVLCFGLRLVASAQATRTWVSGVGDDANPGSRTAPCKTFAGAISKTSTGGEIDVLDPGGFGALTITKAVTIDGQGRMASVLASGTTCITINAGTSSVVLRNLHLTGGTYGVRILGAGTVRLENCVIFNTSLNAVDFEPSNTNAVLYLKDCHIHNSLGSGLYAKPASGGTEFLENCLVEECGSGVNAGGGTVRLKHCTIVNNTAAGLAASGGGEIQTDHDNVIFNNHPDGNPTAASAMK
jgi:hypothetical protein